MSANLKMYLGIDFGTSGCRACIINDHDKIQFETKQKLSAPSSSNNQLTQDPSIWWNGLLALFGDISAHFNIDAIQAICINGTSATVVHCDKQGKPLSDALMYNDTSSMPFVAKIQSIAPENHVTLSASSALSKMMLLIKNNKTNSGYMLNQADWLSNNLCAEFAFSDYNNALKMGFDPQNQRWPKWMTQLVPNSVLPKVLAPGTEIGKLNPILCQQFGFNISTSIKLGTTDSIAAFIATGTKSSQQAVTSIGSTLVLKQLCKTPIENCQYGIYSHKIGKYWLAGGASNSGGKALLKYFSTDQLIELSSKINPNIETGLNYYPLPNTGERFPINDHKMRSKVLPRPEDDGLFLNGLFEGIAKIEHLGYQKLSEIGADYPDQIISCGGGASNTTWQLIRQRILGVEVRSASHSQACYGSALLAKHGLNNYL